ncbi:MAG: hypothetical protein KGD63_00880 [Candidatus Lokiarchaeota archaeon]|nr:hypothetical protein [Candidatus Lokiarchaeota archaeon]
MEKILSQLKLSEESIKIYLESFGKDVLSFQELNSILPEINEKDIIVNLNELLNAGLLIQTNIVKDISLTEFLAIPPYNPILDYFKNIEASFSEIRSALDSLIVKTTNEIFNKNNKIEFNTILKEYKEIENNFIEDSLLQKKDAEDISNQMDVIHKVGDIILEIQNMIKNISQTQFSSLIKTFIKLKEELKSKIGGLEIKAKKEELLFQILEETFKDKLGNIVKDFVNTLNSMIKEEFSKVPFNEIIENAIHSRDDFKMLLLNLLSSFEIDINKISDVINDKKQSLDQNIDELKSLIISKLSAIIQKSIKQIEKLNNPIITLISESKLKAVSSGQNIKQKTQAINSITKIQKYLSFAINSSKEELLIIVPKIEDYLELEILKTIPKTTRIKIASSDPHVNSKVKKFKEINDLEYRKYDNQNFIGVKSDDNFIAFGIITENKDQLNNFIGILSKNNILVNLLKPSLYKIWSNAKYESDQTLIREEKYNYPEMNNVPLSQNMGIIDNKKIILQGSEIPKPPLSDPESPKVPNIPIQSNNSGENKDNLYSSQIQDEKTQSSLSKQVKFLSMVNPKAGDASGMMINDAFNALIQNINIQSGETIAQELDKITELILEKRGFSVTLHNIRRFINDYKKQKMLLTTEQKNNIFKTIEEWKNRLFT